MSEPASQPVQSRSGRRGYRIHLTQRTGKQYASAYPQPLLILESAATQQSAAWLWILLAEAFALFGFKIFGPTIFRVWQRTSRCRAASFLLLLSQSRSGLVRGFCLIAPALASSRQNLSVLKEIGSVREAGRAFKLRTALLVSEGGARSGARGSQQCSWVRTFPIACANRRRRQSHSRCSTPSAFAADASIRTPTAWRGLTRNAPLFAISARRAAQDRLRSSLVRPPISPCIRVPIIRERMTKTILANYSFASPGYFHSSHSERPRLRGPRFSGNGIRAASMHVTMHHRGPGQDILARTDPITRVGVEDNALPSHRVEQSIGRIPNQCAPLRSGLRNMSSYTQNEITIGHRWQTMQPRCATKSRSPAH